MKRAFFILIALPAILSGQSNFSFSGYTANRTYTTNAYTFTNTQNGYTMSTRITHNANPGWINLTGATSPNNATYAPAGCSSVTGIFLASDRSAVSTTVSMEMSFSPAVCGPVTFRIYDINGEDVNVSLGYGFRDDVTISAYDQNNVAIPVSTSMAINNGGGNCGGGNYGASYLHTVGNSLKIVGCTYDNCYWDYFTISSSSKMISRIVIDYASGNRDWYGATISNPARQWIIVADVRAWTPAMNITQNCGSDPVLLTGSLTSAFPPSASSWGIPNASYPAVPSANRPGAPTYSWTGTDGTFLTPNAISTYVSGLGAAGGTFTLTGQNNRGCVATRNLGLSIANCLILPVELVSFDGRCEFDKRIFNWSTASEYNNDHFVLEQSEDADSFKPLAEIRGAGISNELLSYELSTESGGGNYFRLAQYDHDGTISYSGIIHVPCNKQGNLSVYPNPAGPVLNLEWFGATDKTNLDILMVDVLGRIVRNWKFETPALGSKVVVDIATFPSGVYFCKLMDRHSGDLVGEQKFVKH